MATASGDAAARNHRAAWRGRTQGALRHRDRGLPRRGPAAAGAEALAVLAGLFGQRVADLVSAVTNPQYETSRDEHEQYREHVAASLETSPWARVIKVSDFTDNGIGLIHTTGPKLSKLAGKYAPLVPVLRDLIGRADTPLDPGARTRIIAQLDRAGERFAAILQAGAVGRHRQQKRTSAWP